MSVAEVIVVVIPGKMPLVHTMQAMIRNSAKRPKESVK